MVIQRRVLVWKEIRPWPSRSEIAKIQDLKVLNLVVRVFRHELQVADERCSSDNYSDSVGKYAHDYCGRTSYPIAGPVLFLTRFQLHH